MVEAAGVVDPLEVAEAAVAVAGMEIEIEEAVGKHKNCISKFHST